ncbi:hypothetical protein JCM11641_002551 [Rhodosporidiobolus odoratus]
MSTAEDGAILEGQPPAVVPESLLSPPSTRPAIGERTKSWTEILTGSDGPAQAAGPLEGDADADEVSPLLDAERTRAGRGQKKRRNGSESVHRRRANLPWWKRPSPIWFIPGTLAISLSMGLTIAPKIEIYTQLVCRALPTSVSGVTAPPPILVTDPSNTPHPVPSESSPASPGMIKITWTSEDGLNVEELDMYKEWSRQCHKSSAVQSAVARLALVLSLMMGILSSLTTGFWGAYSDRKGRKPVLVLALFGTVLMDAVFLVTVKYHHIVSYNFLLVGPLLDGLLGGYSTAQATTSAYLSDVTPSGSRAHIFSLLGGLMFAGIAIGPLLGSVLISQTGGNALAPFYVALALHGGYLFLATLVLPESLDQERREATTIRHEDEKKARKVARAGRGAVGWMKWTKEVLLAPFGFLKPVAMLLPHTLPSSTRGPSPASAAGEEDVDTRRAIDWGAHLEEYHHPEEVWAAKDGDEANEQLVKRDWTLTKVAGAWGSYMMIMAVLSTKLLYANYTFSWTGVEDGYFLSFIGASRVLTLTVFLPMFIKRVLGRREAPLPTWEKPLEDENGEKAKLWEKEKKWLKVVHDSHFDLLLALSSLFLDFASFALYVFAPHLPPHTSNSHLSIFLLSALLQSLGSGATPAIQSLALAHASPQDAGKLFASLSVVQSLASQVVGPAVFGVVFMTSIGKWSEAVFALAAGLSAVAVGCLAGVRSRRVYVAPRESGAEDEGVKARERGRSGTRRDSRAGASEITLRTTTEGEEQ